MHCPGKQGNGYTNNMGFGCAPACLKKVTGAEARPLFYIS
jgi:hypothetical protein